MPGGEQPCVPLPLAAAWMDSVNATLEAGRSEGLVAAMLLMFLGELDPVDFGADSAVNLEIDDNFGLQSLVARLSAAQRVPEVVAQQQALDARGALAFLAQALEPGQGEAWRLGMGIMEENGFRAGHALVPVGFHRVTGRANYAVRVYDPNVPQREQFLYVDLEANTWRYDGTTEPELPMIYEGTPENGNLLYFSPVTPRLARLASPFGEDVRDVQLAVGGGAAVVLDAGGGVRAGFADGRPVEEGGGLVMPGFSACACASALRNDTAAHTQRTPGEPVTATVRGGGDVYVTGGNFAAQVQSRGAGEDSGGSLSVSGDGREVSYRSAGGAGEEEGGSTTVRAVFRVGESHVVVTVEVHEDADVTIQVDAQGRVEVQVDGAPGGSPVEVTLMEVAPDGSARTSTLASTADENGEGQVAYAPGGGLFEGVLVPEPCTNGTQDGTESDVDCGGDRCVARCGRGLRCNETSDCGEDLICSAHGRCIEAGCNDGFRNGQETDVDCGGPSGWEIGWVHACRRCEEGRMCLEARDCVFGTDCVDGTCQWNTPIEVQFPDYRGPEESDFVVLGANVDGEEREVTLTAGPQGERYRTSLGIGGRYTNARILSQPEDADCRVIGTEGTFRDILYVNCSWSRGRLTMDVELGEDWCAPSAEDVNTFELVVDGVARPLPMVRGPDGEPPSLLEYVATTWSVERASRSRLVYDATQDLWGLQVCSGGSASGTSSWRNNSFSIECSCAPCEGTERSCTSWAREVGHVERLAFGAACTEDRDCSSLNCECGDASGACENDSGLCADEKAIIVRRGQSNFAWFEQLDVGESCPAVFVQGWGAAGAAALWRDGEGETVQLAGGAGAFVRGVRFMAPGDMVQAMVGDGGDLHSGGLGATILGSAEDGRGGRSRFVNEMIDGQLRRVLAGGGGGGVTRVYLGAPWNGLVDPPDGSAFFYIPAGAGASPRQEWAGPGGHVVSGGTSGVPGESVGFGQQWGGGGGGEPGGRAGTDADPIALGGGFGTLPPGFQGFAATLDFWNLPPGTVSADHRLCQALHSRGQSPGFSAFSHFAGAGAGCVSIRCIHPDRLATMALPGGLPCTTDDRCESGFCACGENSGNCTGDSGLCRAAPRLDGAACTAHDECVSDWCECGEDSGACAGDSGVCARPGASDGEACTAHDECISGWCGCGEDSGACAGDSGACRPAPAEDGGACTAHDDCRSQWCGCGEDSGSCTADSGLCRPPPVPDGEACTAHEDCENGFCACDDPGNCPGDSGVCGPGSGGLGAACTMDDDCASTNCECGRSSGFCEDDSGRCGAALSVIDGPLTDGTAASGTFTIPANCSALHVSVWGAAGGSSREVTFFRGMEGGAGGYVHGTLAVSEGDVVRVWLGGGGHAGADDMPQPAPGSLFGASAVGGLGASGAQPFDGAGGGGGGLTSVRVTGSTALEFAVPAGAGATEEGEAPGPGGAPGSGGAAGNSG
ncbi:MAG: hypothetical protein EA398_11585, partial [Deltaproteobacteria bacterium]